MKINKQYFDLSDCKREDLKDYANNKKLGAFKDELHSEVMIDFISLNPKVYSFNHQHIDDNQKFQISNKRLCKGVSKVVVQNEIVHQDYINVIETNIPINRDITSFRSYKHEVFTIRQNKTCLTSFYDKMYMVDQKNSVPFGFKGQTDKIKQ